MKSIPCVLFGIVTLALSGSENEPRVGAAFADTGSPATNVAAFAEEKLDFPIASGPFAPTWESIDQNYGARPAWFREAKFGIWIHFGPQAAGRSGDWYAARLYQPGTSAYTNHLRNFGHPSEVGYKDVLHQWRLDQWQPEQLMKLYRDAGARYVLIMGVHHDNFDLWNSKHQPWNSVNVGPKRDLLGEWKRAATRNDMRFGVSFHHEYTWWWYQPAFGSDPNGPKAGVPYDGNLTLADGRGKWWEGLDPQLLYTRRLDGYPELEPLHTIAHGRLGIFYRHLDYAREYATQWALRIQDVIAQYDPDFIYTDGNSTQPFSGARSGSGYKCDAGARVVAHYYNHTLQRRGQLDTFSVIKFIPANRGVARSFEGGYPREIKTDQQWFGESAVGDWFYSPGFHYDAGMVIRALLENVSRDGNFTVCVSLAPEGTLDAGSEQMLRDIGAWMKVNGDGIYGSRAWVKFGEGEMVGDRLKVLPGGKLGQRQADFSFGPQDFRFTVGKDDSLYAWCLTVPAPGTTLRIQSLGTDARLLDQPIRTVSLLGSPERLTWKQEPDALVIECPAEMPLRHVVGFRVEK